MKYTKNYNFKKPEGIDEIDIRDLNENAEKIDTILFELKQEVDRLKEEKTTSTATLLGI